MRDRGSRIRRCVEASLVRAMRRHNTADEGDSRAPVRVLVADEDRLARIALVCLLDKLGGVEVAAETTHVPAAAELERIVGECRADVVIRRLVQPVPPEPSSAAPAPADQARFRTIILSDTETADDVRTAFAAGADAFLVESRAPEHLAAAVQAVSTGGRFLDPELGARFAADTSHGRLPARGAVTRREQEVLALLAAGETTREIATELGISPRTVEGHRTRVGRKLGLHRRAELIEYAILHRLRPMRSPSTEAAGQH